MGPRASSMARMAGTYERVAALPLRIEAYTLEGLQKAVSSGFERHSTLIALQGDGETGIGEDVSYDVPDHDALQAAGPVLPLAGEWTVDSFSEHVGSLDLFPVPTEHEASLD